MYMNYTTKISVLSSRFCLFLSTQCAIFSKQVKTWLMASFKMPQLELNQAKNNS